MHKILIIDDEKPARDYIADLVAHYLDKAIIMQLENPQEALSLMQKENFDLLFLDVCMPEITGLELLEKIQTTGKFPYTVIISAHREFDYAVKGIELKVVQYVTKPLHKEKIYEVIKLYLKQKQDKIIELKIPKGIYSLEYDSIIAIEIVERTKVKITTTKEVIPFVSGNLSKFSEILPSYFRYIRRDCMLNFNFIDNYNNKSKEIEIDTVVGKKTFDVSRENMKEVVKWVKELSG